MLKLGIISTDFCKTVTQTISQHRYLVKLDTTETFKLKVGTLQILLTQRKISTQRERLIPQISEV